MLFIKRKAIFVVLITSLCLSGFMSNIFADDDKIVSPQASEYIKYTNVSMTSNQGGECVLALKLNATRIVDVLGVRSVEIQRKVGSSWYSADTLLMDDYNYDSGSYVCDMYYYGTTGTQYRAYVEFYVENDGGSETKIVISSPITAR